MISAGREEAQASRLFAVGRSPISPIICGVELHDVKSPDRYSQKYIFKNTTEMHGFEVCLFK